LIFDAEEVRKALSEFMRSSRTTLEPATVLDFEIKENEPVHLSCLLHLQSGRQARREVDAATLCAALLNWCMENNVPLARKAQKAVHVTRDGDLTLDLKLTA